MGIESYGISITTLEEVFINLNKERGITDTVALAESENRSELLTSSNNNTNKPVDMSLDISNMQSGVGNIGVTQIMD